MEVEATDASAPRWALPAGQRLRFEDFDDGIVMFDALVGSTHVLDAVAAETLAIVAERPGCTRDEIRDRLLDRLGLAGDALPPPTLDELLRHLELLALLARQP